MDLHALLPEIEAAAVRGWPALACAEVDGWLWRHSAGGSTRANSVATLAYSGTDFDASVRAVEALSRTRGVSARFAVTDVSRPAGLDDRLAALGYIRGEDHVTMAKLVTSGAAMPDAVTLATQPTPAWMAVYLSGLSEDRRAPAAELLAGLPPQAIYVSGLAGAGVISSGLTIGDGRVASVQCMATLADERRQGGAQRVLAAIEHLAARDGRTAIYLQTGAENLAAQELYRRTGYREIGRYHTRVQPV